MDLRCVAGRKKVLPQPPLLPFSPCLAVVLSLSCIPTKTCLIPPPPPPSEQTSAYNIQHSTAQHTLNRRPCPCPCSCRVCRSLSDLQAPIAQHSTALHCTHNTEGLVLVLSLSCLLSSPHPRHTPRPPATSKRLQHEHAAHTAHTKQGACLLGRSCGMINAVLRTYIEYLTWF